MNIRVSGLREYRLRESVKVTGRYVLSRNRKHASRCEHARNGTTIEPADTPDHDKRIFECPRCQEETVKIVKYR